MCRSPCFGRLHAHHQELTTALTVSGFSLKRSGSSVVGRGLARARPRPKICETVASSWLIYLNCMMMHGPANVKQLSIYTVLDVVRFEFTPSVGAFEFTEELQKIFQTTCYVKQAK